MKDDRHKLSADDLQLGVRLPFDVFDASGRLLLRHDNVVTSECQLERLLREGVFRERKQGVAGAEPAVSGPANRGPEPGAEEPGPRRPGSIARRVSVYASALAAAARLEQLLDSPSQYASFVSEIEDLATALRQDCLLDSDAALAHILFARNSRYPARQQINVAIVTAVLLERRRGDSERIQAAVCAALTMNLTIQSLQELLYHERTVTPSQRDAIDAHPAEGRRMLERLGVRNETWLTLVEQHHEFPDGSGYPNRLRGDQILPEALVIGLADRYCAAITERAYREAVPPDVATNFMRKKSTSELETDLISELVHWVGMYPPGTVVELANRDVAVVTRRLEDPLHPVVHAVAHGDLNPFTVPHKRLTGRHPRFQIKRALPRTMIDFHVDPAILWPPTRALDPIVG